MSFHILLSLGEYLPFNNLKSWIIIATPAISYTILTPPIAVGYS